MRVTDDWVEVTGWALAPGGRVADVTFACNRRRFDRIAYPLPRPDLGLLFWFWPAAEQSGFICRADVRREQLLETGMATFDFVDRRTGEPLRAHHRYYYPDPASVPCILPDSDRMVKVQGNDRQGAFLVEGFSNFVKLDHEARRFFGRSLVEFRAALDWGCGCGRLTRYLRVEDAAARVVGVDVDRDNIGWCQRHLPFADFFSIPLHPPTSLPGSFFDLVIGISVFTHLTEAVQHEWLRELRRITRPGAAVLVTIHGPAAVSRANLGPAPVQQWLAEGFLDFENPVSESLVGQAGYYRNTFHTHDYVRRVWSCYFEVLDTVPGLIGNHQDLVVLRRS